MSQSEPSILSVRPAFDLVIEAGDWPSPSQLDAWFDSALRAACVQLCHTQKDALRLDAGEVSVVLSDDEAMRAINHEHRGEDKPTNVLSFPAMEPDDFAAMDGSRPYLLGDLVFASGTVAREAEAAHISVGHHMAHLIVHGFLHLLGYDHLEDEEAEIMEQLETQILATLNIADPYRPAPDH